MFGGLKSMQIGVDYYPEQWDHALWSNDAKLMAETGVKLVRIAESAWYKMQPDENEFNLEWLDELISLFSNYGISVLLCTPTSLPHIWMYEKYPEICNVDLNGNKVTIHKSGSRCINSSAFIELTKNITEKLAERYADNPTVAAWQIDNAMEASPCFCDVCQKKFREWLIEKYETIEKLNNAFSGITGSDTYREWNQIKIPSENISDCSNPALLLDYNRFCRENISEYVRIQRNIIRRYNPKAKITTNASLSEHNPDFYRMYDGLDFVSCNNYLFSADNNTLSSSFFLDMIRGIQCRNFWVAEQKIGKRFEETALTETPKPNMIKGYAVQALAHGADNVIYYRWRTGLSGYSQGIIDSSNRIGRRYFEFKSLCDISLKLKCIYNTQFLSKVAVIYSPDCEYAFKTQPQAEGMSYFEHLEKFYNGFTRLGANVDIVGPYADLSEYKIVIAANLFINDNKTVENIYKYTSGGGILVLTCLSGVRSNNNNRLMDSIPSVYKDLAGIEVMESDPIGNHDNILTDIKGREYKCSKWCDVLQLNTAEFFAGYRSGFYCDMPAISVNKYCKGTAYYIGTVCEDKFYFDFANMLMKTTGIPRLKGMPDGIEVTTRTSGVDEFIFFFNNSAEYAGIGLPKAMYSIIDETAKEKIELPPYSFDILRR